jgi:hypothetical protein
VTEGIVVALGKLFKALGYAVFGITGLWGLFLCLAIVDKVAGFWGIVVGLFIAPVTFLAAPFYAGFHYGNWFPLVLNYGGAFVSGGLMLVGKALAREDWD